MKTFIKKQLLKLKNKTCEIHSNQISKDVTLGIGVRIYNNVYIGRQCSVGDYSYVNPNSFIDDKTKIGKYCSISRNVLIGIGSHDTSGITTHPISYSMHWNDCLTQEASFMKDTKIGNDVWIGAGAIVLNGVVIGDGAVIGAGAVVTKDVEPYVIVAGVPAKVIKKRRRFNDLDSNWWDLPIEEVKKMMRNYYDEEVRE